MFRVRELVGATTLAIVGGFIVPSLANASTAAPSLPVSAHPTMVASHALATEPEFLGALFNDVVAGAAAAIGAKVVQVAWGYTPAAQAAFEASTFTVFGLISRTPGASPSSPSGDAQFNA
jgi:hypothetical protein